MKCTDCRWFRGKHEPKRVHGENPKDCGCPVGVICPDLIEDDSERYEGNLADMAHRTDLTYNKPL